MKLNRLVIFVRGLSTNPHFLYGAPLLVLVVGGSFVVKFYQSIRYENMDRKRTMVKSKELTAILRQPEQRTLEEEYEEMRSKLDIDNWKNIRGPRPWEGDNTEYKDLIERRIEESKRKWTFR